ncbi:MAG: CHAT domain-containing protein [Chitinophagales bacterium]
MENSENYQGLKQADILFEQGQILFQQNTYNDFHDLFQEASLIYWEEEEWEKYFRCRQRMGVWNHRRNHLEEGKKIGKEALILYGQKIGVESELKGDLHYVLFTVYFDLHDYEEAKKQVEKALFAYEAVKCIKGIAFAIAGLGGLHAHTHRYQEAILYYFKAMKLKKTQSQTPNLVYNYFNIAYTFYASTQYNLAQSYFLKTEYEIKILYGVEHPAMMSVKGFLGEIALRRKQFDKAKTYLQEAIALQQKHNIRKNDVVHVYLRMGKLHAFQNNWTKAEYYFQLTIDLSKSISPNNHESLYFIYGTLGGLYELNQKLDLAEKYYKKALHESQFVLATKDFYGAEMYLSLSRVYLEKGAVEEAFLSIEQAISYWKKTTSDDRKQDRRKYFFICIEKIQICLTLFKRNNSNLHLQAALQLIPIIHQEIKGLRIGIFQEGDKLRFNQKITNFYQLATDVLYEQYRFDPQIERLQEIFALSEKNKAHSLLSTIRDAEALQLSSISDGQLKELSRLQIKIKDYQNILQKMEEEESGKEFDQDAEELVHLQVAYHELTQSIEQNHPEYLQSKYQVPETTLQEVQSQLAVGEAVISYTLTKDYLYILQLLPNQTFLQRVTISHTFYELLDTFIDEGILGMNRKTYVQVAHQLYQMLIAPIEEKLEENNVQSLLIIPDNRLLELPFEILLTHATPFRAAYRDMPYLLKNYSIRYHYSATLRQYQQNRETNHKALPPRFLGFAPVYDETYFSSEVSEGLEVEATRDVGIGGKNYKALLYSEKEVNDIQSNFQKKGLEAKTYLRAAANLSDFKKQVLEHPSKYLHIAAHGVSNRKKNVLGILFSPDSDKNRFPSNDSPNESNAFHVRQQKTTKNENTILYAHEVYQLKLQCDLVFLSCCESGIGKIAEGEGILSINRGLLYSGVSNIVFTLFKIYDRTTAQFAHHFYDYLLNEEDNYAQALRYAKLQLIAEDLSPKYWSGFLLLGE